MTKGEIMSGWHLKKEVTVGQIVTLATLLISGVWWASTVETRLAQGDADRIRIEQNTNIIIGHMTERHNQHQDAMSKIFSRIERQLERIEDKLDKKEDKK